MKPSRVWLQHFQALLNGLPSQARSLANVGLKWALGGAVVGVLIGLSAASNVPGFFRKILVFGLWVFAGTFIGASFTWGNIASVSKGGAQALDSLVRIGNLPLQLLGKMFKEAQSFTDLVAQINRLMAQFIGRLSAGCPYFVYVLVTRQTELPPALYVAFVILGGILGLLGINLLIWLGTVGR